MKLSKEDLIKKISEKITDNDLSIELLEDIEDSFTSDNSKELEDYKTKYEALENQHLDLQKRYKERFTMPINTNDKSDVNQVDTLDSDELQEKEIIDIKEIF